MMTAITNAVQLLTELRRIEQNPEALDLELLAISLSDVSMSLLGLSKMQAGLIQIEPAFLQAVEVYRRIRSQLESAMFDGELALEKRDLPPYDMLMPLYKKLHYV